MFCAFSSAFEKQIWDNRRLLKALVIRDIKLRYAGATLGVLWSIIQPLTILLLYIIVFSTLNEGGRFSVGDNTKVTYAVFLCPCLLAWNWLSEALNGACSSVLQNAALIKKSAFPTAVLPAIPLVASFVPFFIVLLFFFVYQSVFTDSFAAIELLLVIPVILLQLFFTLGVAYFVAALNVAIRDTSQILMSILQIMFWASPIVYDKSILTNKFAAAVTWFAWNPAAKIMDAWRDAVILHTLPQADTVHTLLLWSVFTYIIGKWIFRQSSPRFVEQV